MLNSASDYQYVDTSNVSQFIHGNILPVRNPTGTGVARCAYEDYLFLLEAYNERMHFDSVGQNDVTPSMRTIPALSVEACNLTYAFVLGGKYVSKDSTPPTNMFELTSQSSYPDWQQELNVADISVVYPNSYSSNSPYELDIWCNKFYNATQMTRWMHGITNIGDQLFNSWHYENTTYYSDGQTPTTTSGDGYSGFFYNYTAGTYHNHSVETFTTYTYTEKNPIIWTSNTTTIVNVANAVLWVSIRAILDSSGSQYARYFAVPIQCTFSNNSLSLPIGWLTTVGQQVAAAVNKPYYTSAPLVYDSSKYLQLYVTNIILLIDFDFPANFTNWNYTP